MSINGYKDKIYSTSQTYANKSIANHHGGCIRVGDFVYGSSSGTLACVDLKTGKELEKELAGLADLDIKWVLGEHRDEDLLEADLVVLNPAIPRCIPLVERCVGAGVPLETEMNLFFKYCRGKSCASTGSNGKTTTTSLAGAMARQRWPELLIGGNIGRSLLPQVDQIAEEDWVLLELSSFQLDDLASIDRRPNISVITNLSENHIDWHGSYDNYLAAKRQILRTGPPPDIAVLNLSDPLLRKWAGESTRELRAVSTPAEGITGVITDMDAGAGDSRVSISGSRRSISAL